jgi:hypothetical protein
MVAKLLIGSMRTFLFAITTPCFILGVSQAASAFTIYQAEKTDITPWTLIPFAQGQAAEASFISNLSSAPIQDDLDSGWSTPGPVANQSLFGGLATITTNGQSSMKFNTDSRCYKGSWCIMGFANINPALTITFKKPVESFGFWANDQNTGGDQINVTINGGPTILGPSSQVGKASFFGFIASNPSEYITSLELTSTNASSGFLVFDQFTTSLPKSSQAVPGPVPVIGTAMAFGWTRRLRQRIRLADRSSAS